MIPKRMNAVPNFALLLAAALSLCLWACGKDGAVFVAERAAPVGGEFIRLYGDGNAEYGYAVVKENLKARGGYRYANDTIWFLAEAFKPHFPAGYLPIFGDSLFMGSGLHFRIVKNDLK
jgi:hypothetical protein